MTSKLKSCHDGEELEGVDVVSKGRQQAVREWRLEEISVKKCASSCLASVSGKKEGVSYPWIGLNGDAIVLRKEGTSPTQVRFQVVGDGAVA